jgi:hypothetical protein
MVHKIYKIQTVHISIFLLSSLILAKEWETNIDEIVSLTNENLAALERARQSLKPVIQQNDKKVGIVNMPAMKLRGKLTFCILALKLRI